MKRASLRGARLGASICPFIRPPSSVEYKLIVRAPLVRSLARSHTHAERFGSLPLVAAASASAWPDLRALAAPGCGRDCARRGGVALGGPPLAGPLVRRLAALCVPRSAAWNFFLVLAGAALRRCDGRARASGRPAGWLAIHLLARASQTAPRGALCLISRQRRRRRRRRRCCRSRRCDCNERWREIQSRLERPSFRMTSDG